MSLLRLLTLLWVFMRYRLDTLLTGHVPWQLKPLFWLCSLFPKPSDDRGECLRIACEQMGPVYVKFGQLLSTRPDLVPSDIVKALNHLQDNVTPFDGQLFKAMVAEALGSPIEALFSEFDDQPLASASIAQVHAAKTIDGREVVIKVVRPGIAKTIEKDLKLMRSIAAFGERWLPDGKRLRLTDVVRDYDITITDELDLQKEGANACQLKRNFEHSPMLYVPQIHWDYSTNNILVMERIHGIPVTHMDELRAQGTNIELLAKRGVEIFFTQVFEHNFFHADMHPGNIFVSKETPSQPKYIAIDTAIIGSLTREDQYYLARNLLAMFKRDYRLVAELHVQSGWVPKSTRVGELEAAVRSVCEPIFGKPLAEISFGRVLITLFKTARRFNMSVQPQLVLLQKTLLNIEGLGRQIYPELDLWETAKPFLERWLKEQYRPKALINHMKRYGPEWWEKLPQLPSQILNTIERVEHVSDQLEHIEQMVSDYQDKRKRRQKTRRWEWLALAVAAGAAAFSTATQSWELPTGAWLSVIALLLWSHTQR